MNRKMKRRQASIRRENEKSFDWAKKMRGVPMCMEFIPLNRFLVIEGDDAASRIMSSLHGLREAIVQGLRPSCRTCDTEFTMSVHPAMLVQIYPVDASKSSGMLNHALCASCSAPPLPVIEERIMNELRQEMFKDLRVLPVSDQTGHA